MTTRNVLSILDIEELARWALEEHGLTEQGWSFAWHPEVQPNGTCNYTLKQITLSRPIFDIEINRDSVLNTILHEVAHAIAGPLAFHGPEWQRIATSIGTPPERSHPYEVPWPVLGSCDCGYRHGHIVLPPLILDFECKYCAGLIVWTPNPSA